jgi:hypothetical protein
LWLGRHDVADGCPDAAGERVAGVVVEAARLVGLDAPRLLFLLFELASTYRGVPRIANEYKRGVPRLQADGGL